MEVARPDEARADHAAARTHAWSARSRRRLGIIAGFVVTIAVLLLAEYRLGYITGYHVPGGGVPMVRSPSLRLDLRQALGLQDFYSQLGQDKWVVGIVYPGVTDGYFVDVGAWDAEIDSNSKALEELGWTGICVDPFPQNWKNRTCRLFEEVAYGRAGEIVRFRAAGQLGGIDDRLGFWKDDVQQFPIVELRTTTLADILERAGAPPFIHYLSIDTEGSELDILAALPFERYTIGALTVEHNFEEPKRGRIRALLESKGYERAREQLVDDWYVLPAAVRARRGSPGGPSAGTEPAR